MPTYKKCPKEVTDLALTILCEFETHKPLLDAKVRVDFMFAMPDLGEDGQPLNDAIPFRGQKALGLTRILGLKERAKGNGDAEVLLDQWWWNDASEAEQRALLDHELHHLSLKKKKLNGPIEYDDGMRPKLKMRKHDVEIGWFSIVAARHGNSSMERLQAKQIADNYGQYFWPGIFTAGI